MLTTIPQCNCSLKFPEILSQNHICYHWQSVSGISKIVNCGILIGMPFWALLPLVCPGHRLTFQIFVISMFPVCLLTKGAYLATIFCKQSEKISKKHVRSECKFLTKIEKLRGKREGQAKNRTRFVLSRVNDAINLYQSYFGFRLWKTEWDNVREVIGVINETQFYFACWIRCRDVKIDSDLELHVIPIQFSVFCEFWVESETGEAEVNLVWIESKHFVCI